MNTQEKFIHTKKKYETIRKGIKCVECLNCSRNLVLAECHSLYVTIIMCTLKDGKRMYQVV